MANLGKLLAGAFLALLLPWWLDRQLEAARTELGTARADTEKALDANQTLEATIRIQGGALAGWQAAAAARSLAVDQALEAGRRDELAAAAAAGALKQREAEDAKLPDCEKLLALDLAGVCPGHARGLLERAAPGRKGSGDAGPGADR
jgi:hypothetical protein